MPVGMAYDLDGGLLLGLAAKVQPLVKNIDIVNSQVGKSFSNFLFYINKNKI